MRHGDHSEAEVVHDMVPVGAMLQQEVQEDGVADVGGGDAEGLGPSLGEEPLPQHHR